MKRKIIYLVAVAIILVIGVFIGVKVIRNNESKLTSQHITNDNVNEVLANILTNTNIDNNTANENNITNNVVSENETETDDAEMNETQTNENEENKTTQNEEPQTDEEKAIELVKKEWGEDDTVNFVYDGRTEDNEIIIAVRQLRNNKSIRVVYCEFRNKYS